MRVVLSVFCSVLVLVTVGCGDDNPNEPSDALVLYFDQIEPLDTQETRLFDAIGSTRTTAIAGTTADGLAAYNSRQVKPETLGKKGGTFWKLVNVTQWVQVPPIQSLASRMVAKPACIPVRVCSEPGSARIQAA